MAVARVLPSLRPRGWPFVLLWLPLVALSRSAIHEVHAPEGWLETIVQRRAGGVYLDFHDARNVAVKRSPDRTSHRPVMARAIDMVGAGVVPVRLVVIR